MSNAQSPEYHSINRKAYGSAATIVDLSANPYDLRPAVDAVLIQIKRAIAGGLKPLIAVGESHDSVGQVSFAFLLSEAMLKDLELTEYAKPVIALESPYNLVEMEVRNKSLWQRIITGSNKTLLALSNLKQASPSCYHRLNLICSDSIHWVYAPITRLQNFMAWRNDGYDVRLVDIGRNKNDEIDFLERTSLSFFNQTGFSCVITKEDEFMLRNVFMAQECIDILQGAQAVIFQTGLSHLAGWREEDYPYNSSLNAINWKLRGIRLINVFQESSNFTFLDGLTTKAQKAMCNPETIILRGGIECKHMADSHGSYEEEIETLRKIYEQTAVGVDRPQIVSQEETDALRLRAQRFIAKDLREITEDYVVANPPLWRRVLSALNPS